MAVTYKSLGDFERYIPKGGNPSLAYCARTSDGADWYGLIHPQPVELPIKDEDGRPTEALEIVHLDPLLPPGPVYATAARRRNKKGELDDFYTIETATTEPDYLFPAGRRLILIEGYEGTDPHEDFAGTKVPKE